LLTATLLTPTLLAREGRQLADAGFGSVG
jgi:hypothetical protein